MKYIKIIARQRHVDTFTGKKYNDTQLKAVNAFYEQVIAVDDNYNEIKVILQFEEEHPELRGWIFNIIKEESLTDFGYSQK